MTTGSSCILHCPRIAWDSLHLPGRLSNALVFSAGSAFEGRNLSCLVSRAKTADFPAHALLSFLAASGLRDALGPS